MSQQPSVGLMQALAPIASRRPVHLVVSAAPGGLLNFVCQPLHLGGEEDPEIAAGFAAVATAEELDRDLAGMVAQGWAPAHQSLQSVIDQVAARAEAARQATLRKQAEKTGKGKEKVKEGTGAEGGAQTTLAPPADLTATAAPTPAAPAAPLETPAAEAPPATASAADEVSDLFA